MTVQQNPASGSRADLIARVCLGLALVLYALSGLLFTGAQFSLPGSRGFGYGYGMSMVVLEFVRFLALLAAGAGIVLLWRTTRRSSALLWLGIGSVLYLLTAVVHLVAGTMAPLIPFFDSSAVGLKNFLLALLGLLVAVVWAATVFLSWQAARGRRLGTRLLVLVPVLAAVVISPVPGLIEDLTDYWRSPFLPLSTWRALSGLLVSGVTAGGLGLAFLLAHVFGRRSQAALPNAHGPGAGSPPPPGP